MSLSESPACKVTPTPLTARVASDVRPTLVEAEANTPESIALPPMRGSLSREAILAATSLSVVSVVEELAIIFCVWAVPEASTIWLDRLMPLA